MKVGPELADAANQVGVELVRIVRVVTADDVHLGQRFVQAPPDLVEAALEIPGPALGLVPVRSVEPAELAVDGADVGRVEVHVADEVGVVAVLALANHVGHRADGHQLAGLEQAHAVVERSGARRPSTLSWISARPAARASCSRTLDIDRTSKRKNWIESCKYAASASRHYRNRAKRGQFESNADIPDFLSRGPSDRFRDGRDQEIGMRTDPHFSKWYHWRFRRRARHMCGFIGVIGSDVGGPRDLRRPAGRPAPRPGRRRDHHLRRPVPHQEG